MRFVRYTKTQLRIVKEKRLLAEAEEAIAHEWSKVAIVGGLLLLTVLFLNGWGI